MIIKELNEYETKPLGLLLSADPSQNTMGRRALETIDDLIYDLTLHAFCVSPKLNTQRLIAQQGAFLCFGMELKEVEISDNAGNFGEKYFKFSPVNPELFILPETLT